MNRKKLCRIIKMYLFIRFEYRPTDTHGITSRPVYVLISTYIRCAASLTESFGIMSWYKACINKVCTFADVRKRAIVFGRAKYNFTWLVFQQYTVDGWMDGWMKGWTDGWVDGWMDR